MRDSVATNQKAVNDDGVEVYTELGANTGGNLSLRDLQVRAESAYAAVQADYSNKGSTLDLAGNLTDAIGNYLAKASTGGTELGAVVTAYQAVLVEVEAGNDPSAELVSWKNAVDAATATIFGGATTRDGVDVENTILNASDNADLAPLAQAVEQQLLTFNNRFDLEETAAIREAAFSADILDEFIGVSDVAGALTIDDSGALAPTAPTIDAAAATAGGTALRTAEDTLEARNDLIELLSDARDAEASVNASIEAYQTADTELTEAAETLGYEVEEVDNGFEYGTDEADLFLVGEESPTTVIISDFAADDALYLGGEAVEGDLESADNNQFEFFISSNAAGDAIVQVENTEFGSVSENFTEITLTGVNADSLNVNGGLITVVEAA